MIYMRRLLGACNRVICSQTDQVVPFEDIKDHLIEEAKANCILKSLEKQPLPTANLLILLFYLH